MGFAAVPRSPRWHDPELGNVSLDEFIHVAEHSGEIHAIGRWVIDEACTQARQWSDAGTPRAISVNISPLQLAAGSLVSEIHAALHRRGIPTSLLNIEITESAAIADLPSAAEQLRTLINAGVGVASDGRPRPGQSPGTENHCRRRRPRHNWRSCVSLAATPLRATSSQGQCPPQSSITDYPL